MNASSWLNLRLTGVFTSDSLISYPTLVEHLDFKRTPRPNKQTNKGRHARFPSTCIFLIPNIFFHYYKVRLMFKRGL